MTRLRLRLALALALLAPLASPIGNAASEPEGAIAFEVIAAPDGWPAQLVPVLPDDRFGERLRNADFAAGLAHWTVYDEEIGGGAAVDAGDGGVTLRVENASRDGSLFVTQHVPIQGGDSLDFRVRAEDDGGIVGYAFILREVLADGEVRDVLHEGPPTFGAERAFAVRWGPASADAKELIVHLRVSLAQGADTRVRFDAPSVRPAAEYEWHVDGAAVPQDAPILEISRLPPGERRVSLDARLADGTATAAGASTLTMPAPPPAARAVAPAYAVAGTRVAAAAAGGEAPMPLDLLPPWELALSSGSWKLDAAEVGGRATLAVERAPDGATEAVVRVTDAARRGSVSLALEAPLHAPPGERELVVAHRDQGNVTGYGFIVRHVLTSDDPPAFDDTLRLADPSPELNWTRVAWGPEGREGVRVVVLLRFLVDAGATAEVRFRDPTFAAPTSLNWTLLDGTKADDASVTFSTPAVGATSTLSLAATRGGATTRSTVSTTGVAEAPLLCRGADGSHRLLWRPEIDLSDAAFSLVGADGRALLSSVRGREGGLVADVPAGLPPGPLRLVADDASGDRGIGVARADARPGTPVATAAEGEARVGSPVTYRVRTCGEPLPTIALAGSAGRLELPARDVGGGWHEATFTPTYAHAQREFAAGEGTAVVRVVLVHDLGAKVATAVVALVGGGLVLLSERRRRK